MSKVERLCSTSLAEVGVAVEDFVDALQASRLHDVSTVVYEQLMALDDFVTFKKLMVSVTTRQIPSMDYAVEVAPSEWACNYRSFPYPILKEGKIT